jgi:hypothetical protein
MLLWFFPKQTFATKSAVLLDNYDESFLPMYFLVHIFGVNFQRAYDFSQRTAAVLFIDKSPQIDSSGFNIERKKSGRIGCCFLQVDVNCCFGCVRFLLSYFPMLSILIFCWLNSWSLPTINVASKVLAVATAKASASDNECSLFVLAASRHKLSSSIGTIFNP